MNKEQRKAQLIAEIEKFAIEPPTQEDLKSFTEKVFLFLKEAIDNEKFDAYIDKQLVKLADDKIDGYDAVFAFIRALITKI